MSKSNSSTPTKAKVVSLKSAGKKPQKKSIENFLDVVAAQSKAVKSGKLPKEFITKWEPTPEQREAVRIMSAGGMTPEDIGKMILQPLGKISASTVRRKFRDELEVGAAIMNQAVIAFAYSKALSDGAMARFWLRTRCGWVDTAFSGGSAREDKETETVSKKMRTTAKFMAETLPRAKTGTE